MGTIWAVILAAGIPSAVFGVLIRELNKQLDRREKAKEEKEQARLQREILLVDVSMASLELAKATAEAVQRIPDSHCNGDMDAALNYAKSVQTKYRDFERVQSIKSLG